MITIVYASRATAKMDAAGLLELLEGSRVRNTQQHITGMMFYAYEGFVQQIEGEADAVDRLFANIVRDPRHTDVRVLSRRPIHRRRYAEWAMGAEHPFVTAGDERTISYQPTGTYPLVNARLISNRETAENLLMLLASRKRWRAASR
jgi:hypothetical protein